MKNRGLIYIAIILCALSLIQEMDGAHSTTTAHGVECVISQDTQTDLTPYEPVGTISNINLRGFSSARNADNCSSQRRVKYQLFTHRGDGKIPKPLMMDHFCEDLTLFPSGIKSSYHHFIRLRKFVI